MSACPALPGPQSPPAFPSVPGCGASGLITGVDGGNRELLRTFPSCLVAPLRERYGRRLISLEGPARLFPNVFLF